MGNRRQAEVVLNNMNAWNRSHSDRTLCRTATVVGGVWLLAVSSVPGFSAGESSGRPQDPATGVRPQTTVVHPALAALNRFVGSWVVTEKHFDESGRLITERHGTEQVAWTLDGHVLRKSYTTSGGGSVYRAVGMITWSEAEDGYVGFWFDNVSTNGPTRTLGRWDPVDLKMTSDLESQGPDGVRNHYKVVEKMVDEKTRRSTTFLVRRTEIIKRLEVTYKKSRSCPSTRGFRVIEDDTAPERPRPRRRPPKKE